MIFRMTAAAVLGTVLGIGNAWATQAQPVPVPDDPSISPQLEISGVGIATGRFGRLGQSDQPEGEVKFSDSALFIGGAQKLYSDSIGSFGLGTLTTDSTQTQSGASLFVHQAFVDWQGEAAELLLGRSDNPTAHIVDFPTLREEDLITLTNPLDPFSDGIASQDHRYSNVGSFTLNQRLTYFENIHAQHQLNSAAVGSVGGINSFGVTFHYLGAPGMEPFDSVPSWGVGYEHVALDLDSPGGLHQFYGGGIVNLNESVTDRFDFRIQDLVSMGSNLASFARIADTFQANSNSVAAAFRYLHSPFGKPGYQLALTAGFKNYFRVPNSNSAGAAITVVKRLGQGFDGVAQYSGQWRAGALAEVQSNRLAYEQAVELGFTFNFDAVINPHLSPRRTLLNQRYGYVVN